MGAPEQPKAAFRAASVLAAALLAASCQGMDRLEPDEMIAVDGGDTGSDRGTVLDGGSGSGLRGAGPLTEELARRWLRQIQAAEGEERLQLAQEFWREYPEGDVISEIHELAGDAYSDLGRPQEAAAAWERAIVRSWPAPDILALPLTNVELPYEVGWARYQAGDAQLGADWLVRATFISDRPQLEQGLRFLYAELSAPLGGFDAWYEQRRAELAVEAPDFELPGYQTDSLRLSEVASRLTLINFWTPT
jgi:tetratricopeptide (TPR) repeat protein